MNELREKEDNVLNVVPISLEQRSVYTYNPKTKNEYG